MMVALHVSSALPPEYNTLPASWWWIGNATDALARPSVPLFIMISGALLLNPSKNLTLRGFFSKRFQRVVIPFIFWIIVYLLWRHFYLGEQMTSGEILAEIASGPVYYHLWFIYMLFGLYLATPILRVWSKNATQKDLLYFLGLWFLGECIVPFIEHFGRINIGIDFVVATYTTGYFVLGYYLHHYPIPEKYRWLALAAFVGAAFVTLFGSYFLTTRHHGIFDETLNAYLSPNVVLMSAFLFDRLRKAPHAYMQPAKNGLGKVVWGICSASFSVYLMHPILLDLFDRGAFGFVLNAKFIHPLIGIPLTVILTVSICTLAILGLRKIPGFKFILQ